MRIEVREVTVVKSIFIADDGTEFHDSAQCRNYEIEQLEKIVELYTMDFERTDFHGSRFANLKDAQDIENFKRLSNYCGMSDKGVDDTPGVYMWNHSQWINLTDIINRFNGGVQDAD